MFELRALTAAVLYWYIAIFQLLKHQNHTPAVELNLFFLAPLLQCTFIDRCALQLRAKKKYFIKFLSPLSFKKYFLFLSFPLSGFSSFFLFPSHFFSLPHLLSTSPICYGFIFIAVPRRYPTLPIHLAQFSISPLIQSPLPT